MKRIILVIIALIMASTLVFASVSPASAAPSKLQIEITGITDGKISYDYAWKHINVTYWLFEVSRIPAGESRVEQIYKQWFFASDLGSDKITINSSGALDYSDAKIIPGYSYYVEVLLYGKGDKFLVGETAIQPY